MMKLIDDLLDGLPDGDVLTVRVGLHWTGVVVEADGGPRCGLASTQSGPDDHAAGPDVPQAGELAKLAGFELAALARSEKPTLRSVGVAAINALLPRHPESWVDRNAEEVIAAQGEGKQVALIGHFPFIPRLREQVGALHVLELNPHPGDLPAEAAPDVLPEADVVALTSMTVVNHTLEELLALCAPQARVIMLGPSTPLSPLLFERGIDLLCGSVVIDVEPVLRTLGQGGVFRQVHKAGVRLVSMERPGLSGTA